MWHGSTTWCRPAESRCGLWSIVILVQFRDEKDRRAVLSNYKADVYETWQLWLERDVVKRICFTFSIPCLVFKLHEFKFEKLPNCGETLQIFAPENVGIQTAAPLICVIKLYHIPTSWQRSGNAAPRDLRSRRAAFGRLAWKIRARKMINK